MRHRASDLSPAFDTASYGRGFAYVEPKPVRERPRPPAADLYDTGSYDIGLGFATYVEPAPVRERGRPLAVAGTAAVALLGAALLITGATQVVQREQLTGLPVPQAGPTPIAAHQASGPGPRHLATGTTNAAATTKPAPGAAAVRPAQGTQLPNTIRLPQGGMAYLVHVQVANDGSLPIPSGVDQAVWWGTGLTAASGATVFAGHVNWAGVTGPFAELWHDTVGAVITVRDNTGTQWRYQVTQVLTLNKDQLPQQAPTLFSASGPPRVVLATCGGEWVGGTLGYADNRVVVATPIGH